MEAPEKKTETFRLACSRKAMAAEFEITFNSRVYPDGTRAAIRALDEVDRLEAKLSVFKDSSQVSFINKVAAYDPVQLDDELFELISWSIDISRETEGAMDITSGPLWRLWGFARRKGQIPDPAEIEKTLEITGSDLIELDPEERTIGFRKPGVEINFGCIGKGLALDLGSKKMLEAGVEDFIFHGGLSSVSAYGEKSVIGIAHPMRPGTRLAEISLQNRSLGTSGSQQQFFIHKGKRYSHILDPKSGWPAQGSLLVSVCAPSAVMADVLSTAFFVWGKEKTISYCESHPEISVFFVTESPRNRRYEFGDFGFPDGTLRYLSDW